MENEWIKEAKEHFESIRRGKEQCRKALRKLNENSENPKPKEETGGSH